MKRTFAISVIFFVTSFASIAIAQCVSGNCERGYGVYYFSNGVNYDGTWRTSTTYDAKPERRGFGEQKWDNGDSYRGEFHYDKRNGYGEYIWPNGQKYIGNWKSGTRHGYGTTVFPNGLVETGLWEDGKFKSELPDLDNDMSLTLSFYRSLSFRDKQKEFANLLYSIIDGYDVTPLTSNQDAKIITTENGDTAVSFYKEYNSRMTLNHIYLSGISSDGFFIVTYDEPESKEIKSLSLICKTDDLTMGTTSYSIEFRTHLNSTCGSVRKNRTRQLNSKHGNGSPIISFYREFPFAAIKMAENSYEERKYSILSHALFHNAISSDAALKALHQVDKIALLLMSEREHAAQYYTKSRNKALSIASDNIEFKVSDSNIFTALGGMLRGLCSGGKCGDTKLPPPNWSGGKNWQVTRTSTPFTYIKCRYYDTEKEIHFNENCKSKPYSTGLLLSCNYSTLEEAAESECGWANP